MEHTLRDMATGVSSANNIEVKRHELDDIKRSQEQLEQAMSQQGNYTFLPESQQVGQIAFIIIAIADHA